MRSHPRRLGSFIVGAALLLAGWLAGAATAGAAPGPEAARAQRLPGGQGITLTESAWQTVVPTTGFVQREPKEGAPPSQPTEFRITYDATTLFVRVRAFDAE